MILASLLLGHAFEVRFSNGLAVPVDVAPQHVRRVDLPGTAEILRWTSSAGDRYAITLDGREVAREGTTDDRLLLRRGSRVPRPGAAPGSGRVTIVQFWTPAIPELHRRTTQAGARILAYLPAQAVIADVPNSARAVLEREPGIRSLTPLTAQDRLSSELDVYPGRRRVIVQLFENTPATRNAVVSRLRSMGLTPGGTTRRMPLFEVEVTAPQARAIAGWDEVAWVEAWTGPEVDMDVARAIGGADVLETVAGYAGARIRGAVTDAGVRPTHVEFSSRPLLVRSNGSSLNHGTSTTGIVFADGTGNGRARGMLPLGQGIFTTFVGMTDRYASAAELARPPYEAFFESNSWGSSSTTQYTTRSQELDRIVFDLDLLIVQSMGNTGSRNARPEAWAKNVLSIGGVAYRGTLRRDDDAWTTATFGPAADGRIKPDLTHFYDGVLCPTGTGDIAYNSAFDGTSAATPIVAGYAGLAMEMWIDGAFGNSVLGANPFAARPKSSTARALLINTASPYPFSQVGDNLDRSKQGWGLPSAIDLWNRRDRLFVVDETDPVRPLETRPYRLFVPPGTPDLRATMVYTDVPGTLSAGRHRVNDLTLTAISPSGVRYWGNAGLTTGNASVPGGSPDEINPVENIFVAQPEFGIWTIEVSAPEINQDGRPETSELDADFALVVTGAVVGLRPESLTLRSGRALSGSLDDLATSNERRVRLRSPGEMSAANRVRFESTVTLPTASPERLGVVIEAATEVEGGVTIELWNAREKRFEFVGSGPVGPSDALTRVWTDGELRRFVDDGNRVTARFTLASSRPAGAWSAAIDQIRWLIGG